MHSSIIEKLILFTTLCSRLVSSTDDCGISDEQLLNDGTNITSICTKTLDDARTYVQNFNTSIAMPIVAGLSSAFSVLADLAIIVFVLRSTTRLSTVYHRIMLGMSLGDLLASLATMLTTIPVPAGVIYEYAGATLGNNFTCSLQGFAFWFGSSIAFLYCAGLSIYYLCYVKYKMKDDQIKKCIEPLIHTLIFLFSIVGPVTFVVNKRFNPTPLKAWCTATSYPWWCGLNDPTYHPSECMLRGETTQFAIRMRRYLTYHYTSAYFATFLIIIVSMALIVRYVRHQEECIQKYIGQAYGDERIASASDKLASVQQRHDYTKLILKIALAYVFSATFTQGTALLHTNDYDEASSAIRWVLQAVQALLGPLQGFFNGIIFFTLKTIDLRAVSPDKTYMQALIYLFKVPEAQLVAISEMSLVVRNSDNHAHHRKDDDNWEEQVSFDGDDDDNYLSYIDEGSGDGDPAPQIETNKSMESSSSAQVSAPPSWFSRSVSAFSRSSVGLSYGGGVSSSGVVSVPSKKNEGTSTGGHQT